MNNVSLVTATIQQEVCTNATNRRFENPRPDAVLNLGFLAAWNYKCFNKHKVMYEVKVFGEKGKLITSGFVGVEESPFQQDYYNSQARPDFALLKYKWARSGPDGGNGVKFRGAAVVEPLD